MDRTRLIHSRRSTAPPHVTIDPMGLRAGCYVRDSCLSCRGPPGWAVPPDRRGRAGCQDQKAAVSSLKKPCWSVFLAPYRIISVRPSGAGRLRGPARPVGRLRVRDYCRRQSARLYGRMVSRADGRACGSVVPSPPGRLPWSFPAGHAGSRPACQAVENPCPRLAPGSVQCSARYT
jgi:hypothetical protein